MVSNTVTNKPQHFSVEGMHCASCSQLIKRRLTKLPGVTSADVNYGSETAAVSYDPKTTSLDTMNAELQKMGYSLTPDGNHPDPHQVDNTPSPHQAHVHHETHQTNTDTDHSEHIGLNQSKQKKLEELADLQTRTEFALPVAMLIFVIMVWDITSLFFSLPPFPIPMYIFNPISFIAATIILFWIGKQYITAVGRFIRYRIANMDSLVGIGTITAYVYSSILLLFPGIAVYLKLPDGLYFDVTIVVIGFITLGKFLETRSKLQTGEAIEKLLNLQAKNAVVLRDGKQREIPVDQVVIGDILIIKPGQKIPVDAVITSGSTAIDESMITGEPLPSDKNSGDTIVGATINTYGSIQAKATKVGNDTVLAQIIQMVRNAQGSKAPIERLADSVSAVFVPVVLVVSVVTLASWLLMGPIILPAAPTVSIALMAFVGILVIACPCAMGLATPTAVIVGVGKAAQHGILIKNAESLEKFSSITTVVLDKTGTLTKGKPEVTDIHTTHREDASEVLKILASLEQHSEHPLAVAITKKAASDNLPLHTVENYRAIPGKGLTGVIENTTYFAGNNKLAYDIGVTPDTEIMDRFAAQGKTPILLMTSKKILGIIGIADTVKDEAKATVVALHRMGLTVTMLTGDSQKTTEYIAEQLGIDRVIAEVLPADKASVITTLQQEGLKVAMVGDGINDAPALAQADVGVAMGTGTDVAIESAGITLLGGNIAKLPQAVLLAKKTMRVIKQNLFWAFSYNIILIPIAAGILYPFTGILLNPGLAAFAMAASSISVVGNSLRLKNAKI